MTQEIGFIHLSATVLVSGLLDDKITQIAQYEKEKKQVRQLLNARYDLGAIPGRSRPLFENLINQGLRQWWAESWFNVQVYTLCAELHTYLHNELALHKIRVLRKTPRGLIVEGLSAGDFKSIQHKIDINFPGLICYYEVIE